MPSLTTTRVSVPVVALTTLLALASTPLAALAGELPCGYTTSVIDPPDLPGLWEVLTLYEVNDLGVAAGRVKLLDSQPCVWSESTGVKMLPMPPGVGSAQAAAINNNGWVLVNGETDNGTQRAFVYQPVGDGYDVVQIPWTLGSCWANGLNDLDQVVGWHQTRASGGQWVEVGFTWTVAGGLQDTGIPGWKSARFTDINNAGMVCGNVSQAVVADPGVQGVRAFVLTNEIMGIIEPPTRYTRSYAVRVNDAGVVGGDVKSGAGASVIGRGFTFDPADRSMKVPGPPAGWNSWSLRDLNETCEAVGIVYNPDFAVKPCVASTETVSVIDALLAEPTYSGYDAFTIALDGTVFTQLSAGMLRATPIVIPSDLDCNGVVDQADLSILLAAWNERGGGADLDKSGTVDGTDLGQLLSSWTS